MATKVKSISNGAVKGESEVTIDITNEEAKELRDALMIVQRYEKMALKATNITKACDWWMMKYRVRDDKVIISVTDGACG